jgi:hypothetical protein
MFYTSKLRAKCFGPSSSKRQNVTESLANHAALTEYSTGTRCALFAQQAGDGCSGFQRPNTLPGCRRLAQLRDVSGCLRSQLREATKAAILLIDQVRKHLWPELSQCLLNIATPQATSGSSALEQGAFPLFDLRLELGACR